MKNFCDLPDGGNGDSVRTNLRESEAIRAAVFHEKNVDY